MAGVTILDREDIEVRSQALTAYAGFSFLNSMASIGGGLHLGR